MEKHEFQNPTHKSKNIQCYKYNDKKNRITEYRSRENGNLRVEIFAGIDFAIG